MMAAKSHTILLAGVMSGVAVSLLCVTAALLWDGHSLRQRLHATAAQAADLRSQQADAQTKLDRLETELSEMRRAAVPDDTPDTAPAPRRARIVHGNQVVGWGWVHAPPTTSDAPHARPDLPAHVVLDAAAPPANAAVSGTSSPSGATPSPAYNHWWYAYNYGPSYLLTSGWIDWGPYCTNNNPHPQPPFAPPQSPAPDPAMPAPGMTPQPAVTVRTAAVAPPLRRPAPIQPATLPRRFPTAPTLAAGASVVSRPIPAATRPAAPVARTPAFTRTPIAAPLANRAGAVPQANPAPLVRR
ncbi:MAG: hypothetical protein HS113_06590 [Verrucomicrobiales bacterium]|nr:hypothetical protein [Verrucomicrobiales bacterium]